MADIRSRTTRRFVAIAALAVTLVTVVGADTVFASKAHNSGVEGGLDLLNEVISQVHARYVDEPSDKKLIEGAINGMLTALDPHSSYMDEEQYSKMSREMSGEFGGVGLEIEAERGGIRIVRVIDGTPASKSNLAPNDIVIKIDGETSDGMPIEKAVDLMHGTPGSKVTLTVTRKGVDAPISVTLRRDVIRVNPVQWHAEGSVGYIRVTSFNGQTAEKLADAITATKKSIGPDLKGYVLDLRNNPGGLLDQAIAVSSEVLTKGVIVSIKGRTRSDSETFSADSGDLADAKPIVVLINGGTASAAEIVAGALQDDKRAILVGTLSFGKGTVQTIVPLDGRGALRLTTARYYTPSGRSIQARGIDPDAIVEEKIPENMKASVAADTALGGEHALANHLKNPDGESGADGTASAAYVPENPKEDTQLQYALDVLNKLPDGAVQADVPRPSQEVAVKAAPIGAQ